MISMPTRPWIRQFLYDPIQPLLEADHPAISYFLKRDLLEESGGDISQLWELPAVQNLLQKQQPDGSWKSTSSNQDRHPAQNYQLLETFRHTNILVNKYGLNREHPGLTQAAEYLFCCQTGEGDIRGIIGEQYAPYYNGIIISNLIRAGYAGDPRLERAIQWLLTMRQNDGGWVIGSPGCLGEYSREEQNALTTQFVGTRQDFNRDLPSGHAGTGMVIRAFAAHPIHRSSPEAQKAGELLANALFKKNTNSSYQHPDHWVRFKYPFWWTDLVSALDSLSRLGFSPDHPRVAQALVWFRENQLENGLWKHSYSRIHKYVENKQTRELQLWISLAVLRIVKAFPDF